jgi:hypothetical protein
MVSAEVQVGNGMLQQCWSLITAQGTALVMFRPKCLTNPTKNVGKAAGIKLWLWLWGKTTFQQIE